MNHDAKNAPITKSPMVKYKILPKELSSPNVIYIYEDKIANVLWSKPPVSFVIKDKNIADSYRRYFNFLWKISTEMLRNLKINFWHTKKPLVS